MSGGESADDGVIYINLYINLKYFKGAPPAVPAGK
jgi:hypothetical protein